MKKGRSLGLQSCLDGNFKPNVSSHKSNVNNWFCKRLMEYFMDDSLPDLESGISSVKTDHWKPVSMFQIYKNRKSSARKINYFLCLYVCCSDCSSFTCLPRSQNIKLVIE